VRSDRFEWDDTKAQINYDKHRVSFEKAIGVFDDPLARTFPDHDHSFGEEREITFGTTFFGELLVVGHTVRDDRIRIFSARHATKAEKRKFMSDKFDLIRDKGMDDDLRPEYDLDFTKGEVGKYYQDRGRLVVRVSLDPDVARHFSTTDAVNEALRQLIAEGRAPEPRNE